MKFIDTHDFPVGLVLRVCNIASSTYYDWRARQTNPCQRTRDDATLLELIDEIRSEDEHAGTYGSPRVWWAVHNRGIRISRKRVARVMRVNGRRGAYLRKGWKHGSTKQNPNHHAAPDRLDRDFSAFTPNHKWVADLTRIDTDEGVLWLATVRDAFSNKVVGWDSGPRATAELVCQALDYAIFSRDIRDGKLIHHFDKGSQYTSVRFTQRLCDAGIAPSTGSVGDSFDNALAENLWSTLKIELIYWPKRTFDTRAEAQQALFRYIDGWYNARRIQAGLGGLSPDQYEAAWHARQPQPQPAILQPQTAQSR